MMMKITERHRQIIIDGAAAGVMHAAEQTAKSVSPHLVARGMMQGALGFAAKHLTPAEMLEILDVAANYIRTNAMPAND